MLKKKMRDMVYIYESTKKNKIEENILCGLVICRRMKLEKKNCYLLFILHF